MHTKRRRRLPLLIVGAFVVALFASACSGASSDNTLVQLAETMPAPLEDQFVFNFTDYEHLAQLTDTKAPGTCEDPGDRAAYTDGLVQAGLTYPLSLPDSDVHLMDPEQVRTAFGYDVCDIRASATPSSFLGWGPQHVTYLAVSAGADDIATAVASDAQWSSRVSTRPVGRAELYDWGNDHDVQNRSAVRPLGVGGQLAVFDAGIIVHTRSSQDMDPILDRDLDRFMDLPHVRAEITALTNAGAFRVRVSNVMRSESDFEGRVSESGIEPLVPWVLIAEGHMIEGDGFMTQMVFVHDSAEDARTNATRMQSSYENGTGFINDQPFTERFTLVGIDVDDKRVVATMQTNGATQSGSLTGPSMWTAMFITEG